LVRSGSNDSENEIQAIIKLCTGHPNTVQVINHGPLKNLPLCYAINMEYCEYTLEDFIVTKESDRMYFEDMLVLKQMGHQYSSAEA
jgi:hypothetical protein